MIGVFLSFGLALATAEISLRGMVTVFNSDHVVLDTGKRSYTLRKERLPKSQLRTLEQRRTSAVSIVVPMEAIDGVSPSKLEKKK